MLWHIHLIPNPIMPANFFKSPFQPFVTFSNCVFMALIFFWTSKEIYILIELRHTPYNLQDLNKPPMLDSSSQGDWKQHYKSLRKFSYQDLSLLLILLGQWAFTLQITSFLIFSNTHPGGPNSKIPYNIISYRPGSIYSGIECSINHLSLK